MNEDHEVDAIEQTSNVNKHQSSNDVVSMIPQNPQFFFNDPYFKYSSFRTVFPHVSSFALQDNTSIESAYAAVVENFN
jgi:hypothetical protein